MAGKVNTINRTSVAGRLLSWSRLSGNKQADQLTSVSLRLAALPGLAKACAAVRENPASIKKLPVAMAIETVRCLADDDELDLLAEIIVVDKRVVVHFQANQELVRLGVRDVDEEDSAAQTSNSQPLAPPTSYSAADVDEVLEDLGRHDVNALIGWINAAHKQPKKAILAALQESGYAATATPTRTKEHKLAAQVLAGIGCATIDGRIAVGASRGTAPTSTRGGKVAYPGAWVAWRAWAGPVTKGFLESVLIREEHWPQEYESEELIGWLSSRARKFTPDALSMLRTSPDPVLLSVAVNRQLLSDKDLAKLLETCDVYTLVRLVDMGVNNDRYQALFNVLFARMHHLSPSEIAHVVDWLNEDWSELLPSLTMTIDDLELLLTVLDIRFAEGWSTGSWKIPPTPANLERVANAMVASPSRLGELTGKGGTNWSYAFEADTPLAKTLISIIPGLVHVVFASPYHWAEDAVCAQMYQAFGANQRAWEIGLSLAVGWPGTLGDYFDTVATLEAQD